MTKELILEKIRTLLSEKFSTQMEAFAFFDENNDGKLDKRELVQLLKKAEVNGFIRGAVASKLIERFDNDQDGHVNWSEFKMAINKF